MLKFIYLNYFFLIIPVIISLLLLYFYWWKKYVFWWMNDLKNIFKANSYFYKFYYILLFFIFIFYITIFAKPVLEKKIQNVWKNWIDIQIVLDVSYSMTATDLPPNRLEVAKDVISNFIDNIETDRVWLIIYSWKVFTSLPLSFDYKIIKKTIEKIDINIINQQFMFLQWTATWDALILAWKTFPNNNREKVIILLTDWESNRWVNPLSWLEYLEKKGLWNIRIYTIWLWWDEKTTVSVINNLWLKEELEIWWLNEWILKTISSKTDWKYFRATNRNSLEEIFETISKLEKKEIISKNIIINKEKYTFFVYLLILIFYIFIILKYKKRI